MYNDFWLTLPYSFLYMTNLVVTNVYPRELGCSLLEQPDFCKLGSMCITLKQGFTLGCN